MIANATEGFLTADQLGKRLQVAPVTVRLWTRQGDIPVTRCNRLLRYRYAEVIAAFEREQRAGRQDHDRDRDHDHHRGAQHRARCRS